MASDTLPVDDTPVPILAPGAGKTKTGRLWSPHAGALDALSRCFDDGRLALDNNPAERALRWVAIGRKNYLFAGSDAGGRRAAAIYSLNREQSSTLKTHSATLPTCCARIADHPARQIADLLPCNWTPSALPPYPASSPSGYRHSRE